MKEVRLMDLELLNYQIILIIKVSGFKIKLLGKESLWIRRDKYMKDNGRMTDPLELDIWYFKMDLHTKDNSIKVVNMVLENIRGLIKKHITKEIGTMM